MFKNSYRVKDTEEYQIVPCVMYCFLFALYRDSDKGTVKAELLHSNSCLRMLYTDLQKNIEMEEDSIVLFKTENRELKNQIIR